MAVGPLMTKLTTKQATTSPIQQTATTDPFLVPDVPTATCFQMKPTMTNAPLVTTMTAAAPATTMPIRIATIDPTKQVALLPARPKVPLLLVPSIRPKRTTPVPNDVATPILRQLTIAIPDQRRTTTLGNALKTEQPTDA